MNARPSGLIVPDDTDEAIHLPPGQTPITSPKRIARLRKQPASVGWVDDQITALAKAMLIQYGPLAVALNQVMARQLAFEDFCLGTIDAEQLKARIEATAMAPVSQTPTIVPEMAEGGDGG